MPRMSKQIYFYATDDAKILILTILNNVFGQIVSIPYYKSDFSTFDEKANGQHFYLAEENRARGIFYRMAEYDDGTTAEVLDYRKSPVLEYAPSFKSLHGEFCEGRFYCCSDDLDFSKNVSKFFTKLKKEFRYVKKYKVYISPDIDLSTSKFDNKIITEGDLSVKVE